MCTKSAIMIHDSMSMRCETKMMTVAGDPQKPTYDVLEPSRTIENIFSAIWHLYITS